MFVVESFLWLSRECPSIACYPLFCKLKQNFQGQVVVNAKIRYCLSGRAVRKNIWLEVMTHRPSVDRINYRDEFSKGKYNSGYVSPSRNNKKGIFL